MQKAWNPELWQSCYDLVAANLDDDLLEYLQDDLIHYTGEFNAKNLLGFKVKPEVSRYSSDFRTIAIALRSGFTLAQARQAYGI